MPKKFYKHKLLFDENVPPRLYFPNLNQYFDVKHIRDDLKKGKAIDKNVYDIAVSLGRIIITSNIKDFRPLAGSKKDAGIIGIPDHLLAHQLDTKLTAFFKKTNPKILAGKYVSLMARVK